MLCWVFFKRYNEYSKLELFSIVPSRSSVIRSREYLVCNSRGFINVSELNFLHGICFGTSVDEKCKSSVNFHLNEQLVKMEIF